MNEADTRENLVLPRLKESGWNTENIEREFPIRKNRFYVAGEEYKEIQPPKKYADFVLKYNNIVIGVVEVKKESKSAEDGIAQAKDYSQRLDVPIAYATNGHKILVYDRRTLEIKEVDSFLPPEELFQIYKEFKKLPDEISSLKYPNYIFPGKRIRSYQETAVKKTIEAIVKKQKRILLTMATGTGKTFTSFQIVWKLIKSNYFSRVLFLTDRIFLRDQAYDSFEPFKTARSLIKGNYYEKNRKIYFSTYQTLYTNDLYKKIPEDFFDLIIIDECHRSGYGDWGEILKHFNKAYHLGMTATPKREDNIDVYEYFGNPVFEYSMKKAIEDGFLVPFKIYKVLTNLDKEGIQLNSSLEIYYDDEVDLENLKPFYQISDFERRITLPERTEFMCKKFLEILKDDKSKTIIYCVDMQHAQQVTTILNKLTNKENFATRIVSEEKDDLTIFKDAERTYPVVATTVDLLSTGIDIPHLKNIVFMRPIASTVLFKQIIGRGARLSSNKGFFRIIDFTNATRLLDEWDRPSKIKGVIEVEEPLKPFNKKLRGYIIEERTDEYGKVKYVSDAKVTVKVGRFFKDTFTNKEGYFEINELPSNKTLNVIINAKNYKKLLRRVEPTNSMISFELKPIRKKPRKLVIKGIKVEISEEITIEINDNRLTKGEYIKNVKDTLKKEVHTLDDLREIWLNNEKREDFLKKLKENGIELELLEFLENANNVDGFDLIAHILFKAPLITTEERAKKFYNTYFKEFYKYNEEVREILIDILDKYKKGGIENLDPEVLKVEDLKEKKALNILKEKLGLNEIPNFFEELKEVMYSKN